MPKNIYGAYVLIGGGTGALDAIDGADLADLDMAVVTTLTATYRYSLDADSAAGEASPTIIAPDANAGDKRWILTGISQVGAVPISTTQWGYLGALAKAPLGADTISGRVIRGSYIYIDNGTTGISLKCTLTSRWNGDAIAQTDDIGKGATTGSFTLDADGKVLTIEAAGLSGNVNYAMGTMYYNASGVEALEHIRATGNDIVIGVGVPTAGTALDITTLVDTGQMQMQILYITDA